MASLLFVSIVLELQVRKDDLPTAADITEIMVQVPAFFRRRSSSSRQHDEESASPRHNEAVGGRSRRVVAAVEQYSMRRMPTLMEWIQIHWVDLLSMACVGAVTLGLFHAPLVTHRLFPVYANLNPDKATGAAQGTGDIVYPEFAYPYDLQLIPSWAASVLSIFAPAAIIALAQVRVRSFWDFNNGILGLFFSLCLGTFVQVLLKWLIGGLRPNFYDACRPDPALASLPGGNATGREGTGFGGIMYSSAICTTKPAIVDNALESFPSGHTTASFAALVYLSLYLNAKLKVRANYQPAFWKLVLVFMPVIAAVLVGGSVTVDHSHNWYDVVAGAVIGTTFAFVSYGSVYVSVWDWRVNHIPAHRGVPFDDNSTADGAVGMKWTVTRRVGWGAGRKPRKDRGLFGRRRKGEQSVMEKMGPLSGLHQLRQQHADGVVTPDTMVDGAGVDGPAVVSPSTVPAVAPPTSHDIGVPPKAVGSGVVHERHGRRSGDDMV